MPELVLAPVRPVFVAQHRLKEGVAALLKSATVREVGWAAFGIASWRARPFRVPCSYPHRAPSHTVFLPKLGFLHVLDRS